MRRQRSRRLGRKRLGRVSVAWLQSVSGAVCVVHISKHAEAMFAYVDCVHRGLESELSAAFGCLHASVSP